jgi:iron complex outermembrane recepter protein
MSELINTQDGHRGFRRQLLASVSAFALISFTCAAFAEDDRPTLWIELGAQSEQVNGFGDPVDIPFAAKAVSDGFQSPTELQRVLSQSFGEEGAISFQPENSDWVFSISARYGRAEGGAATHEQTPANPREFHIGTHPPGYGTPRLARYSETHVKNDETHTILDFQVGKDVGVGLFKNGAKSIFGFGVRFAQFTSKQTLGLNADPDYYLPSNLKYKKYHHAYLGNSHIQRSFRGIGPSISWNASAPVIGNAGHGALTLDWGVNASILFGRQKVLGHHQITGNFYKTGPVTKYHFTSHTHQSGDPNRSHTVTVPNLGGFAGLSYVFTNAKLSVGYRGDFFFGAIDGGIDAAKKETRGFYGPFASVSVGLGG